MFWLTGEKMDIISGHLLYMDTRKTPIKRDIWLLMKKPPKSSEKFLHYFHRDMERQQLHVYWMTEEFPIQQNINDFMIYDISNLGLKTVPYGSILLYQICSSTKYILVIWFKENMEVFHTKLNKISQDLKTNGIE